MAVNMDVVCMKKLVSIWRNISLPLKLAYIWITFISASFLILCIMNWDAFGAATIIVLSFIGIVAATIISLAAIISHIID